MRANWTSLALTDLSDAVSYIAKDNTTAAQGIATQIWKAINLLVDRPGIGRPGRVPGTRERVVPDTPYIIAYRVENETETVVILRILHGTRKWPSKFRD